MKNWISCSEVLPDNGRLVLAYSRAGYQFIGSYSPGQRNVWYNAGGAVQDGFHAPTHWMPLPEPPA